MPSFQDSAFIILLGLLLFGPKGLASIARQLGKLMGEFRRASADFRMQMEDELRIAEQVDQQKKIAEMEAAAPPTPLLHADTPEPEHPHNDPLDPPTVEDAAEEHHIHEASPAPEPLPIATSGDLDLMPPATGLPIARNGSSNSLSGAFDNIPQAPDRHTHHHEEQEATTNG